MNSSMYCIQCKNGNHILADVPICHHCDYSDSGILVFVAQPSTQPLMPNAIAQNETGLDPKKLCFQLNPALSMEIG